MGQENGKLVPHFHHKHTHGGSSPTTPLKSKVKKKSANISDTTDKFTDYSEESGTVEFTDWDDDDDDNAGPGTIELVRENDLFDTSGLSPEFDSWLNRRRQLFDSPFNDPTPSVAKGDIRSDGWVKMASKDYSQGQQFQLPRVVVTPKPSGSRDITQGDFPLDGYSLPSGVIHKHHDKWSKKRALPASNLTSVDMKHSSGRPTRSEPQAGKQHISRGEPPKKSLIITEPSGGQIPEARDIVPVTPAVDYPLKSFVHFAPLPNGSVRSDTVVTTGFDDPIDIDLTLDTQRHLRNSWEPVPDYDFGETDVDEDFIDNTLQSQRSAAHVYSDGQYQELPEASQVKLTEEFDPKNFMEKVPDTDTTGKPMPPWKRLLVARQMAEKAQIEAEEQRKREKEEARFRNMPLWKRALIEKKEGEKPQENGHAHDVDAVLDEDGLPVSARNQTTWNGVAELVT